MICSQYGSEAQYGYVVNGETPQIERQHRQKALARQRPRNPSHASICTIEHMATELANKNESQRTHVCTRGDRRIWLK